MYLAIEVLHVSKKPNKSLGKYLENCFELNFLVIFAKQSLQNVVIHDPFGQAKPQPDHNIEGFLLKKYLFETYSTSIEVHRSFFF